MNVNLYESVKTSRNMTLKIIMCWILKVHCKGLILSIFLNCKMLCRYLPTIRFWMKLYKVQLINLMHCEKVMKTQGQIYVNSCCYHTYILYYM